MNGATNATAHPTPTVAAESALHVNNAAAFLCSLDVVSVEERWVRGLGTLRTITATRLGYHGRKSYELTSRDGGRVEVYQHIDGLAYFMGYLPSAVAS
jgi:hypothetical protein